MGYSEEIAATPFTLPCANCYCIGLGVYSTSPVSSVLIITNGAVGVCLTFTSVFFIWCVNYVASEIESPFGDDANDVPVTER